MKPFDLIILGCGITGFSAAQYAGSQGARALVVDPDKPGGRSLFKNPDLLRLELDCLPEGEPLPTWPELKERVQTRALEKSGLMQEELSRLGVEFVSGQGRAVAAGQVAITENETVTDYTCDSILLATGSSARPLPSFPFERDLIFESDAFWEMDELPESILIAGSSLESLAWAGLLRRLGVKVFLTHEATEVLDGVDPELIGFLERGLKQAKVKLLLKKQIKSIFKNGEGLAITLDGGIKFSVKKLMVCGERVVDTTGFLEPVVSPDKGPAGEIFVDEKMKTTLAGLFAAGSITGFTRNPFRSQEGGRVGAANGLGKKRSFYPDRVPQVVQLGQTVASVGCYEGNAHHAGFRGIEGRSILWNKETDLVLAAGTSFCKIVADRDSREIIGGQAVGSHSAELVAMIQMGMRKGFTPRDLTQIQAAWGGILEPLHEAAADCLSKLNEGR